MPEKLVSLHLSIVIPVYNEEKRILTTLFRIMNYLNRQPYPSEVVVVDDGSDDQSGEIVNSFIQSHSENNILLLTTRHQGKGAAVREGILKAQGDYILFSDADLSTPIEETEKFLPWLEKGYPIVIGSRNLPDSRVEIHQPWSREKIGKFFNWLIRYWLGMDFQDTQCGFKCFSKKVARQLFLEQKISHFGFDVEILYRAHKYGYQVKEVPIQWINSPDSRVRVFRDGFRMLKGLWQIRWYYQRKLPTERD